jgi:hypothetical protein
LVPLEWQQTRKPPYFQWYMLDGVVQRQYRACLLSLRRYVFCGQRLLELDDSPMSFISKGQCVGVETIDL